MTTTTETLKRPRMLCQGCGREARGGVLVGRGDGRLVSECCADRVGRSELAWLIGDAAEPEPELPTFIAHDPFGREKGTTRKAAPIIAALRWGGHRQATPEAVAEVMAGRLPELRPVVLSGPAYGDEVEPIDFERLGVGAPIRTKNRAG